MKPPKQTARKSTGGLGPRPAVRRRPPARPQGGLLPRPQGAAQRRALPPSHTQGRPPAQGGTSSASLDRLGRSSMLHLVVSNPLRTGRPPGGRLGAPRTARHQGGSLPGPRPPRPRHGRRQSAVNPAEFEEDEEDDVSDEEDEPKFSIPPPVFARVVKELSDVRSYCRNWSPKALEALQVSSLFSYRI